MWQREVSSDRRTAADAGEEEVDKEEEQEQKEGEEL